MLGGGLGGALGGVGEWGGRFALEGQLPATGW
jgi:hypothetical protein